MPVGPLTLRKGKWDVVGEGGAAGAQRRKTLQANVGSSMELVLMGPGPGSHSSSVTRSDICTAGRRGGPSASSGVNGSVVTASCTGHAVQHVASAQGAILFVIVTTPSPRPPLRAHQAPRAGFSKTEDSVQLTPRL